MKVALLISPLARLAYFSDYKKVCKAELELVCNVQSDWLDMGHIDALVADIDRAQCPRLAYLSFFQGAFELRGDAWYPLELAPQWSLPDDFLYGTKYRGKTNETLTQLMVGLGVRHAECDSKGPLTLLDPMCGRGTTLWCAMRFGLNTRGVERDASVLAEIQQSLKKWTKIHRIKHRLQKGRVSGAKAGHNGQFSLFESQGVRAQVVIGDTVDCKTLLGEQRFSILATDLPYGVQHHSSGNSRNPFSLLEAAAPAWSRSLRPGGVLIIAYNQTQTRRARVMQLFERHSLQTIDADLRHRMSESIVRDII